jgi:hypothetical protein
MVDLAELRFLGLAGLQVRAEAQRSPAAAGRRLVLRDPDALTMRVPAITGLAQVLPLMTDFEHTTSGGSIFGAFAHQIEPPEDQTRSWERASSAWSGLATRPPGRAAGQRGRRSARVGRARRRLPWASSTTRSGVAVPSRPRSAFSTTAGCRGAGCSCTASASTGSSWKRTAASGSSGAQP